MICKYASALRELANVITFGIVIFQWGIICSLFLKIMCESLLFKNIRQSCMSRDDALLSKYIYCQFFWDFRPVKQKNQ